MTFPQVEHLIAWGLDRMLKQSSEENRYANLIHKAKTLLVDDADAFSESLRYTGASHSGVQLRQANHVPEGVAPEDMLLVEAPSPPRRPADGRHFSSPSAALLESKALHTDVGIMTVTHCRWTEASSRQLPPWTSR